MNIMFSLYIFLYIVWALQLLSRNENNSFARLLDTLKKGLTNKNDLEISNNECPKRCDI